MYLLVIFLGMFLGIITGLIPGIHVNLVSILLLSLSSMLLSYFSELELCVLLISMVIVHSFLDFIPSIFLGAPEESTIFSVLPGHEYLLKGKGYYALKLTIIGGFGTAIFCLISIPFIVLFLDKLSWLLELLILPLLIVFSSIFIILEKNRIWALLIFILSGILGLLVLNGLSLQNSLFPLLSGLFGIPVLIISILNKNKICPQRIHKLIRVFNKNRVKNYLSSTLSSLLVSIFPGIGSAQAAMISKGFSKNMSSEDFLVTVGGINTAGALLTLAIFYTLNKTRTGVLSTMSQLIEPSFNNFVILLLSGIIAIGFGVILSLFIGRFFAKNISKINYTKFSLLIIFVICIMVFIFTGFIGVFILSISAAMGLLPPLKNVKRIHSMGCLIIPIIFYYVF